MLPSSAFPRRYETKLDQRVVKLVCSIDLRPHFFPDSLDRGEIQRAEIRSRLRIKPSPSGYRACPSLFKRRIVEKRIRSRVQNLLGERRSFDHVSRNQRLLAVLDRSEQRFETFDVHRFFEAVLNGLLHKRVVGNLEVAARQVLTTCDLVRENGRQQIVGEHPLKLGRNFLATPTARNGKGASRVPSPAYFKHRRRAQCLNQQRSNRKRTQVMKNLIKREAMSRA